MKHKFKSYLQLGLFFFGIVVMIYSCQKDDDYSKKETTQVELTPTIKTVSQDSVGKVFNQIVRQLNVDRYLKKTRETNTLAKTSQDTLGITVYTDEIVEVTLGDYTSYTMRVATPNPDDSKFYNLTLEDKNGVPDMFITKYTPTSNWSNNTDAIFEGSISTIRTNDFTDVFDDNPNDEANDSNGDGSNDYFSPQGSPYYPTDCNGFVYTSMENVPYQCACGDWPWDNCQDCPPSVGTPKNPGYNQIPYYYCDPFDDDDPVGVDNYYPADTDNNPNTGGSSSTGDGITPDDSSITFVLVPDEECDLDPEDIIYDLDENCELSPYERCLKNNYSQDICDCVQQGNLLEDCATDCDQLNAITDNFGVKARLNELRLVGGNFEKALRIKKNPETGEFVSSPILENGNGTNHMNVKIHLHTAILAHNHPDNVFYKMFSAEDVIKMAQMATLVVNNGVSTVLPLELTHIIVFKDNGTYKTYAIRFDDVASMQTLQGIASNKKKERNFKKDLKRDYESDYNYQTYEDETDIYKQQAHFFNFLEKYNLNISIYEANFDNSGLIDNWQKINKETLDQEPCN